MSCVVYWTISNSSLTVVFLFLSFIVLLDINEVLYKIDFYKKKYRAFRKNLKKIDKNFLIFLLRVSYCFKLLKGVFAKNGAYSEK